MKTLQERMEEAMGPDNTKEGIFRNHRCWRCDDGRFLCTEGNPRQCDYPRARND